MRQMISLTLLCCLFGCSDKKVPKTDVLQGEVIVKTPGKYSEKFIHGLKILYFDDTVILSDNYLIANKDSFSFPEDLDIGELYTLQGQKNDSIYQLTLKKINQTSIQLAFRLLQNDSVVYQEYAIAHLYSLFFHGAETIIDSKGNGHLANDYYAETRDSCFYVIKLGIDENKHKPLARIWRGECTGRPLITIYDAPLLR